MEYASKGVGGAGLGLGIAGTALGVLNSGVLGNGCGNGWANGLFGGCNRTGADLGAGVALGAMMGGVSGCGHDGHGCSENTLVNRYEMTLQQDNAAKDAEISLLKANIYGDQKLLEVYKYFDGELKDVRAELCSQKVHNQRTEDSFVLARQDIAAVKAELSREIAMEAERRCCGDESIVSYVNSTFYPKMVADVTTGTETTAQTLRNPLPKCGCCR